MYLSILKLRKSKLPADHSMQSVNQKVQLACNEQQEDSHLDFCDDNIGQVRPDQEGHRESRAHHDLATVCSGTGSRWEWPFAATTTHRDIQTKNKNSPQHWMKLLTTYTEQKYVSLGGSALDCWPKCSDLMCYLSGIKFILFCLALSSCSNSVC